MSKAHRKFNSAKEERNYFIKQLQEARDILATDRPHTAQTIQRARASVIDIMCDLTMKLYEADVNLEELEADMVNFDPRDF